MKTRQSIITLFLARFTLSAEETNALSSPEVPVGPTFFAAVDRAQAIRDDCQVLMAGEDSPSRAGFVFFFFNLVNPDLGTFLDST